MRFLALIGDTSRFEKCGRVYGYSMNSKAATLATAAEQKALLVESLGYLEKARSLDPDRKEANWSYPLYQCYYSLYGADDSRTKEMEALVK